LLSLDNYIFYILKEQYTHSFALGERTLEQELPQIEALYVDLKKVIIKLVGVETPIILTYIPEYAYGSVPKSTRKYDGMNSREKFSCIENKKIAEILGNSPDYGWFATLEGTILRLSRFESYETSKDTELETVELKRGEFCGEPYAFLPMFRSAHGVLVPCSRRVSALLLYPYEGKRGTRRLVCT
jgi:hypothetical protein